MITREQRIADLIKLLSDHYGGDDPVWLREYVEEVIKANRNRLDLAVAAFIGLADKIPRPNKIVDSVAMARRTAPVNCQQCGYNRPFCHCKDKL